MMNWIFTGFLALSILSAGITGAGPALGKSVLEGASGGISLGIRLAGPLCLWSGAGRLMDQIGLTDRLSRLLQPILGSLFPEMKNSPALSRDLSANVCANLLGLGNAATPRGIRAARQLARGPVATDSLCRLIVLNTASIQLIPTSVAAIRSGLGAAAPFDILPAVWITSGLSAGLGMGFAAVLGKLWPRD